MRYFLDVEFYVDTPPLMFLYLVYDEIRLSVDLILPNDKLIKHLCKPTNV